MEIIRTVAAMKDWVRAVKSRGETICLVPTMGYLHEGHLDLMRMGRPLADRLVISIFVNPTQFGVNEDLDKYPRDLPRDTALAESVGVECIFHPEAIDMYPKGYQTYVNVEEITDGLCGASRPGHFRGVTTVVAKLFNIVEPDVSVFGEKDYQQLTVIRKMVDDLNMTVKVLAHPTVREEDGLAMSSRNKYLNPEERRNALVLNRSLLKARERVKGGEHSAAAVRSEAEAAIAATPGCAIDYIEIVHPDTLEPLERIEDRAVMALAVRVGKTRLIDNMTLAV
ncbi:MAG TPA: pantoate--beta-alanine ligase [Deltaproteobacteria bacterium]|jgi:pantoate--beta-alanine ligase|nr:pantoate--beta-alanine ligase [Deltaproteobacteria bacterium]HOI06725.1 pantoate--beta-alanine ligase [Deltaproteobacteria bacterium]